MDLLKELQDRVYNVEGNLYIKYTLFADNSGVFEQANTVKYRPRTRNINAARQHFRSDVPTALIQFTLLELTGTLETLSLSKSPRKTSLSFKNSYSGRTINPPKWRSVRILGFGRDWIGQMW
jgi:hypothetical protein